MSEVREEVPEYFGRGFRVQLAFYLSVFCLFLMLRPPVVWMNFVMIGYLALFWPVYFFLVWRRRSATPSGGEHGHGG